MRKVLKKVAAISLASVMSLASLTGCGSNGPKLSTKDTKYEITDNSEVVFDLGKSTITYGELMYFVAYFEMLGEYEKAYYQANIGYTGDFWSEVDENGNSEAQNYKNNAFQEANYVEVMKNAAIDAGITLSDDELADIGKSARESLEIYKDEQIKQAGLTYEGFYSAQKTLAYTSKYVEQLRNEYLQSDTYKQAMETVKREDNLAYDVNYAYISLTAEGLKDEENKKMYVTIAEDICTKARAGKEFIDIQSEYKDNSNITFGSKVIKKNDDTMDASIMSKLSTLNNDDVTDVIETSYGLFVFQMINNENEETYQEALAENSDKIIEGMITAKYSEHNSDYSIEANEKLIEKIEMGKMTIISK